MQQYSNAAVRGAIHLTGEQQPIRWLQCSRAGRDFTTYSSTAVQQYVQQYTWYTGNSWLVFRTLYEAGNRRGEFHFWKVPGHLGERASRHPPPTIHRRTYSVQQYSNAAVRRAIYLTGEPIRWLRCSRAGRNWQSLFIPRHAAGQASRPREGEFHASPSPRWGTDGRSFAGAS